MFHKYQVYVHIRYKAPSGTSIQSHDRINCSTRTKLSSCSFYVLCVCVFVCGLLKLNSKLRIRPVRTLCVCRAIIDLAQALALQMPLILNISDFCFHCCNINSSSGLLFVLYSVDNGGDIDDSLHTHLNFSQPLSRSAAEKNWENSLCKVAQKLQKAFLQ